MRRSFDLTFSVHGIDALGLIRGQEFSGKTNWPYNLMQADLIHVLNISFYKNSIRFFISSDDKISA